MNTYSKQPLENRFQAAANTVSQKQSNKQASALVDNRPQATVQRKLFSNQSQSNNIVIQLAGDRPGFSGPAAKIKKEGDSLLTGDQYDMAHRLSYQHIRDTVQNGNQNTINGLVKAIAIPSRNFGGIKKGNTKYYNKIRKIKDKKELIKALNNSPYNLRPGNSSVNRSIGGNFDPNIDDSGYETDQTTTLRPFILNNTSKKIKKKQKTETSSYLSDKELKQWEKKAYKEDML